MNWIESVTSVIFVSHNGKSRKLKAERSRDLKKRKTNISSRKFIELWDFDDNIFILIIKTILL
jgi:hypothetical protein